MVIPVRSIPSRFRLPRNINNHPGMPNVARARWPRPIHQVLIKIRKWYVIDAYPRNNDWGLVSLPSRQPPIFMIRAPTITPAPPVCHLFSFTRCCFRRNSWLNSLGTIGGWHFRSRLRSEVNFWLGLFSRGIILCRLLISVRNWHGVICNTWSLGHRNTLLSLITTVGQPTAPVTKWVVYCASSVTGQIFLLFLRSTAVLVLAFWTQLPWLKPPRNGSLHRNRASVKSSPSNSMHST